MNHVSIFEKKWLDLVFEGKNKSYGAYQMRLQHPRTTMLALLFGLLLLVSVVSIGMLAARLGKSAPAITEILDDDSLHVTRVEVTPPPKAPETKATPPVVNNERPKENTQQLKNPVVVKSGSETDANLTNKPTPPETPSTGGIPGVNPTPGVSSNNGSQGTAIPAPDDRTHAPGTLDKMPTYPGGLEAFYDYIGKNFRRPDLDDAKKVTVIVSFVVEKNGTLTDIRVLRDPGYGMAREAIRVLKASKETWTAGVKNGQPVRTAYTLPITVNIE